MIDTTRVEGFRLDALKHIPSWFFPIWLKEMENQAGQNLFTVWESAAIDKGITGQEHIEKMIT